jgi:hypothetical protein
VLGHQRGDDRREPRERDRTAGHCWRLERFAHGLMAPGVDSVGDALDRINAVLRRIGERHHVAIRWKQQAWLVRIREERDWCPRIDQDDVLQVM